MTINLAGTRSLPLQIVVHSEHEAVTRRGRQVGNSCQKRARDGCDGLTLLEGSPGVFFFFLSLAGGSLVQFAGTAGRW